MNKENLIKPTKNGKKLIEIIEIELLNAFSNFFTDYDINKNIKEILIQNKIECGILESIFFYIFLKNLNKYDLSLLIDCLLNLTRIYISCETVKFIHGKISDILRKI